MDWASLFTPQNLKFLLVGQFPGGPIGGLLLTVLMGTASIFLSTLIGTPLGILRASKMPVPKLIATIYIEGMRSIPLVMVVFWLWFVLPILDINVSGPATTVVSLSLFTSAYVAEILRGGLRSVTKGQYEAAFAMGLGYAGTMRYVVLPQVFRFAIPPLTGRYVVTMKNTSLAFLIGIRDFTGVSRLINSRIFAPVEVYTFALITYFLLNRVITMIMRRVEKRLWPDLYASQENIATRVAVQEEKLAPE